MERTSDGLWRLFLTLAVALPLAGCDGGSSKSKIWVYHYPDFYQPQLKRVAVVPFGNRTRDRDVADTISDQVSVLLTNNGTYEVYTRAHLADILKEQDASAAGIIEGDLAKKIGRLKSVQALICGVCDRCETTTRNETRHNQVAIWGTNKKGKKVITGWKKVPYRWTRHDAFVECGVVIVDTVTGRQISAVNDPSNVWCAGNPPKQSPADALRAAKNDQATRIVRALAVTRTQIKLKGSVLKTASGLYDQEWEWQKEFLPDAEKLYLVVKLPPEADRNNFRLTIVPQESREVLAEEAFTWSKQHGRHGYAFAIKPIFDRGGIGEYRAKLYSGPEPIAHYDFKIVEER